MLDPEALKARARQTTGLEEFGAAPLDDGLEAFCTSLRTESGLDDRGLAAAASGIVATLCERLKLESWFTRHPEILQQSVATPIIVVGLPRTGTTALSQFLSEDPQLRSIRRWECTDATPPPDAGAAAPDPRIALMEAAFAARYAAMPTVRSMLPVDAGDPSEHGPLLGLTFRNLQAASLYRIPGYTAWLLEADMRPAYEYMARVLKLLQWKSPASHWNLKNPPDIFALDALADTFPDARIVWTHRDAADSIPSVCSLVSTLRIAGGEAVDKPALGRMMIDFQAEGVRRAMAARAHIGADRVIDVTQAQLSRDPFGAIETLYRRLGLPFEQPFRRHLERRLADRARARDGRPSYTLAEFGLTLDDIRSRFGDYERTFKVPLEVGNPAQAG